MIAIRKLEASDANLFRAARLAALQASPGVFSSSYERERYMPLPRWEELLAAPDGAVFGLFDGEQLVGITSIYTDGSDPSGRTAALAMSYIQPPYRRRGLSSLFYEARIGWAKARPELRRVRVGHRASNEASRRAIERHGFVRVETTHQVWPDGIAEDHLHYELPL